MADDNPIKIPEMVERGARAMCKALGVEPDALVHQHLEPMNRLGFWYATHPDSVFPMWQWFAAAVRAVMEEMRDPTEAMLRAADTNNPVWVGEPTKAVPVPSIMIEWDQAWRAMIDTALGE